MHKIRARRNVYLTLFCFSAIAVFCSAMAMLLDFQGIKQSGSNLATLEKNKPKPATRPTIRMLQMHNTSAPMPTMYATMVLEPDKKTIKIFLCEENSKPYGSKYAAFEGMCGKGDQPRTVMGVMNLIADTDGSFAANEKAMDDVKMTFVQMPPGVWILSGQTVPPSQVEAFVAIMRSAEERNFEAERSKLQQTQNSNKVDIVRQIYIGCIAIVAWLAVWIGLSRQHSLFCRNVLSLSFAGDMEKSADTDRLMPSFFRFAFSELYELSLTTQARLQASRRRLYRLQAVRKSKVPVEPAVLTASSTKAKVSWRLKQLDAEYLAILELLRSQGTALDAEAAELFEYSKATRASGNLKGSLRWLHRAVRKAKEALLQGPKIRPGASLPRQPNNPDSPAASEPPTLLELPVRFFWENESGAINYRLHFLEPFWELTADERKQVVGQLKTFAALGSIDNSLDTKRYKERLPYSPKPEDCLVSRGSKNLRFSWGKNGPLVTMYWLFHKGDSRVSHNQ